MKRTGYSGTNCEVQARLGEPLDFAEGKGNRTGGGVEEFRKLITQAQ